VAGEKSLSQSDGNQSALLRLPAVQALLMQFLSLSLVLILGIALATFFALRMPIIVAVCLQGLLAATLSWWRRLAVWWLIMQAIFFPALFAMITLHLPSVIYLVGFLFLLLLYWSTFRTQVPFYPSGQIAWAAVAQRLPQGRSLRVIDVGSGFGGMVTHLARVRRDCDIIGIELAPLPWLCSRLIAWLTRSKGRFLHGDYQQVDFGDFDVVFAYLSPAAMPALWHKARAEMRTGSVLMSYEFAIPEAESQITNISVINGRNLYVWSM
jgi:SAM-dependent methyltransferase